MGRRRDRRSPLESKKAADVAGLALKITPVIGCSICALGIAFDIVDRYWGGEGCPEWKGAGGHGCAMTSKGVTPAQDAQLQKMDREFRGEEQAA